ncbi:MAG: LacI family DNA-binding transcriptional regulator [Terriglobia bacterium]|jgi:LacI family transcriptional regulator
MKSRPTKRAKKANSVVTLKAVADYVGLTPGTVSAVLNDSAAARSFPQHTKDRVLAAARKLNYRPNLLARALRVKRTYTIGVITEEIGDAYGGMVISGIENYLRQHGYFFLTVAHRHDTKLLEDYSHLLLQRGVEGFITVDTSIRQPLPLPTVAVAGHQRIKGVTNLIVNHRTAARIALEHLTSLGHEEIALMRGPATSSDSGDRWKAIVEVCRELGIRIRPEQTIQLAGDKATPELGYPFAKRLLARPGAYTALFAYNDNCAIAAIRAIHEAGLRVPEDISVVGFDDIPSAAYCIPALTTVRQPLREMGEIAARTLLNRIEDDETYLPEIVIEPELVVRQSTARARGQIRQATGSAVHVYAGENLP